jgi:hypothetical protein
VQQNPEVFTFTVYRESYVKRGTDWIPDALRKVALPHHMILPEQPAIPGQKTVPFWLDLWTPATAKPGRVRVEALLQVGDRWIVYPMEVRVNAAVAVPVKWSLGPVPPVSEPADASASGPWKSYACGSPETGPAAPLSVRQLIRRNALQDVTLARARGGLVPHDWCKPAERTGPEWYLGFRNALLK